MTDDDVEARFVEGDRFCLDIGFAGGIAGFDPDAVVEGDGDVIELKRRRARGDFGGTTTVQTDRMVRAQHVYDAIGPGEVELVLTESGEERHRILVVVE